MMFVLNALRAELLATIHRRRYESTRVSNDCLPFCIVVAVHLDAYLGGDAEMHPLRWL